MIFARRIAVLAITAALLVVVFQLRSRDYHSTIQGLSQSIGLGDLVEDEENSQQVIPPNWLEGTDKQGEEYRANDTSVQLPSFPHAALKSPGEKYSRGLVIGRLFSENTTWLDAYLPTDPDLQTYLYVVDDVSHPLHTPVNKGHEAMVYLTYIIDHYDTLPDISIFMHPHRLAWHTPELLNHDASEVLKRLSSERVVREGYMNLRCYWDPGCPERLHPGTSYQDNLKREELAIAAAWAEMFPNDSIPKALGAPCCAQFAVARHTIQNVPKSSFERYRNWLIRTKETDWISGRVFEYLWHKIFTKQAKLCPDARACYCDGYGICFTTDDIFEQWFDNHRRWREALKALEKWEEKAAVLNAVRDWKKIEQMKLEIPSVGQNQELKEEIDERFQRLVHLRTEALQNGTDPEVRAKVGGRPWKAGDGY